MAPTAFANPKGAASESSAAAFQVLLDQANQAVGERVGRVVRHDEAVLTLLDQVAGTADLIGHHQREAEVHRFVDHQPPGLAAALVPRGR